MSGPGQCSEARLPSFFTELGQLPRLLDISDMHDQRVEARPPFRLVNARHGLVAIGARREAVHRLGRHGDELLAIAQDLRRARDPCRICQYRFRNVFADHAWALYLGVEESQEDTT